MISDRDGMIAARLTPASPIPYARYGPAFEDEPLSVAAFPGTFPSMFEPMRYAALFGILGTLLAGAAVQSAAEGAVGAAWVLAAGEAYVALCLFTMALV